VHVLAETLSALSRRGSLAIEHGSIAAEQFVWMVLGAPLNRLWLHRTSPGHSARQLATSQTKPSRPSAAATDRTSHPPTGTVVAAELLESAP
jgi:hypothetical protein